VPVKSTAPGRLDAHGRADRHGPVDDAVVVEGVLEREPAAGICRIAATMRRRA
jgi:hypothetical protein